MTIEGSQTGRLDGKKRLDRGGLPEMATGREKTAILLGAVRGSGWMGECGYTGRTTRRERAARREMTAREGE